MPTTDPLLQGNVLLDIDGVGVVANFTSVSGISSEVEIVDNPYVNEQGKVFIGKLPGKPKTPTITLKRGLTGAAELWTWHTAVMQGTPDRRNGSVIMMNDPGRGGPALQLHERDGLEDQPVRGRRDRQRRADRGGHAVLRDAGQGLSRDDRSRCVPDRRRASAARRGSEALHTEYAFVLPRGYVDGSGRRPSRRRHAPRHRARRDHPAARSARPRERGVPHGAPPVAGRDEARVTARRSTPASSRGCSPPTWRSSRTSTAASTRRATPRRR